MANNGNNVNIANANVTNNNTANNVQPQQQPSFGNETGLNQPYQATFSDFSLKMGERE